MLKKFCLALILMFACAAPALSAELHMYAGAGLRLPTDKLLEAFQAESGHKVTVEYAGMGQLLTRFQASGTGDVFLSGSGFYVDELDREKAVLSRHKLVLHTAVMAVRKDKNIPDWKSLAAGNFRIAMGDPKAIALGKAGEVMLEKSGYARELAPKVAVRGTTIKQVLMYLENGEVDAAVIGYSDAVKNKNFAILPTPEGTPREISEIAALSTSKNPDAAKALAEFFARPESIKVFIDAGYLPLTR